jgi:ferrous iron transport protein A
MQTQVMPVEQVESVRDQLVPLSSLRAGDTGRVGAVVAGGGLMQRLRELGLRSGARIRMIRAGSPCIFRLEGQKLCVRADEVGGVLVQVAAAV